MHNRVENNNLHPKNHHYSRDFRNARLIMIQKMFKNLKMKFDPIPTPFPPKKIFRYLIANFLLFLLNFEKLSYFDAHRLKIAFLNFPVSRNFVKIHEKKFFRKRSRNARQVYNFFTSPIFQICFGIPKRSSSMVIIGSKF